MFVDPLKLSELHSCSHDVVLLCFNCHQVALTAAKRLKREVSR